MRAWRLKRLQEQLLSRENVTAHTGVAVTALNTEGGELKSVTVTGKSDGQTRVISCDGVFIAIGTPTAGLASAFSDHYNGDTENAVAFTLGTTILCVATIPLLYWLIDALLLL